MDRAEDDPRQRQFAYRGRLPLALAPLLLLAAPLLVVFASLAALALAVGAAAALAVPLLWRLRRVRRPPEDCITLEPGAYRRVEPDELHLPRR